MMPPSAMKKAMTGALRKISSQKLSSSRAMVMICLFRGGMPDERQADADLAVHHLAADDEAAAGIDNPMALGPSVDRRFRADLRHGPKHEDARMREVEAFAALVG